MFDRLPPAELAQIAAVYLGTKDAKRRPPADFPKDAAEAQPLDIALCSHSDPASLEQLRSAFGQLFRIYMRHTDPQFRDDPSEHVRGEFRVSARDLMKRTDLLWARIAAAFLLKLISGELVAWGRVGSPFAPPREIPATAWKVLRLRIQDLGVCNAAGPNTTLYDVHVGQRANAPSVELAPAVPKAQPVSAGQQHVVHTAASEKRLEQWLVDRMGASPDAPVSKSALKREAQDAGLEFSEQGFKRTFRAAVEATGAVAWSAPGRKPARHIDMPN